VIYPVALKYNNQMKVLKAKLDTGAYRSSIDSRLVKELDIPYSSQKVYVKSQAEKHFADGKN